MLIFFSIFSWYEQQQMQTDLRIVILISEKIKKVVLGYQYIVLLRLLQYKETHFCFLIFRLRYYYSDSKFLSIMFIIFPYCSNSIDISNGLYILRNVCLPRFVFWNWIIFKPAFHDKRKVFLGVISILYFEVNFSHLFHFAGNHFAWGVTMLNNVESIFRLIINAIN